MGVLLRFTISRPPATERIYQRGLAGVTHACRKLTFELQDQDIELLHSVYELRIATIVHLATLSGRSVRALWGRLHKLKERRYLATVARFMQKQVYAIGSEARPVLVEHGYAPRDFAERRLRHNELTEIGIRHSLFVAEIHTRMMLLTRSGPIKL